MKKIYNEYKENIQYFFTKKSYIIPIILLAILCYGFYITNFSLGVDDFSQDRYVTGTYLLSQGRWGNVLLANLLNNTNFVPFWTEFITTILMVFIAILLSAFVKKEIGDIVNKTIYYVLFSGMFISYPLIHHIFLYNFANVITALTTLSIIIVGIIIYENTFNVKNKYIYYILALIMPFIISMYEASCQTYLVFIFITAFINIVKNNKVDKKIIIYIINCILILVVGIILNIIINTIIKSILTITGKLTIDYSARSITWFKYDLQTCFKLLHINIIQKLQMDINQIYYIGLFFILSMITLIISAIQSIGKKIFSYIFINIIIILSNFIINFIQINVIYRTNTSWSLTIAFMVLYILIYFKEKEIIKNTIIIFISIILLYNSKTLTFAFYNDIIKYEREKNIAYDIANTIVRTCEDPYKPLVYIPCNIGTLQGNSINMDNGWPVIAWGFNAFGERGTEITKFINAHGYNFRIATNQEWEDGYNEFKKIEDNYKDNYIVELEDYIIVKIIYESR